MEITFICSLLISSEAKFPQASGAWLAELPEYSGTFVLSLTLC